MGFSTQDHIFTSKQVNTNTWLGNSRILPTFLDQKKKRSTVLTGVYYGEVETERH